VTKPAGAIERLPDRPTLSIAARRRAFTALAAWLLAAVVVPAAAERIYVPGDYSSISAACLAATSGDSVLVNPGDYAAHIYIKPGVVVKALGTWDNTRIWVMNEGDVIQFTDEGVGQAVLEGFHVNHHSANTDGSVQSYNPEAHVRYCHLEDWFGDGDNGDSIILWNGGTVEHNLIGGGALSVIYLVDGAATIVHNTFEANCHANPGTAFTCDAEADYVLFSQNTFSTHSSTWLDFAPGLTGRVVNNIFNVANIYCSAGGTDLDTIDFNLWQRPPVVTDNCEDLIGSHNLMGVDPMFCIEDACWDFSLDAESPCVGAGENGETLGAWPIGCGIVSVPAANDTSSTLRLLSPAGALPLRVAVPSDVEELVLFDVGGRRIARSVVPPHATEVAWTPPVPPGVYYLREGVRGRTLEVLIVR